MNQLLIVDKSNYTLLQSFLKRLINRIINRRNNPILKKCLGVLILFSSVSLTAQNIAQDLQQMYETYKNLNNFSSNIKIFIQSEKNAPYDLFQEGKVRKRDKDYYVQMGEITHLQNTRCKLTINYEHRQIGYIEFTEADKIAEAETPEITQSFEALLAQQDISKFQFIAAKNGQKHYRLVQPDNIIEQMDMYLNAATFLLEKLEYSYNEALMEGYQKVRIEYIESTLQPNFKKEQFSEYVFIKKSKGAVVLRSAYAQYSLSTFKNEPNNEK